MSSQNEISLNEISAADFLAAVDNGLIDLNEFVDSEKVANSEEATDLSQFSNEELLEALQEIEGLEQEKTAQESDDSQYWREAGRQIAIGYAEEMNKEASEDDFDLNQLSVDEFINLGRHLSGEMDKEASNNRSLLTLLQNRK